MTIKQARKALGTMGEELSDKDILKLMNFFIYISNRIIDSTTNSE